MSHSQTLGAGDALGTGDSYLTLNVLPPDLAAVAFDRLREQVKWMSCTTEACGEVPRLVAVEGSVSTDGSYPIYRHPADESPFLHPFTPTVEAIRQHVQGVLQHPVNHVLIQFYRTGTDYISEHSDKTIDVVRGSNIVNVSLGAQRVMTLRLKRERAPAQSAETEDLDPGQPPTPRTTQRIPLPHNSMFVMGPETNAKWLHGIKQDNRFITYKSEAETFQLGERISLTFRHIGTFLSADQTRIWGQGATSKTVGTAQPVLHGVKESENLVIAFGAENHQMDFDWDKHYGMGFDVVNFKTKDDEE